MSDQINQIKINNQYKLATRELLEDLENLKQEVEMHEGLAPFQRTPKMVRELKELSKQIERISADFADVVMGYDEA